MLTRRCNLNCIYCHGGEERGRGTEIRYSLDDLAAFLSKDDDPQLMLYGGEPTLRVQLIKRLMDRFPNARFMLQTNGLRLNRIPENYVKRFHSILVSIDGPEELTDYYRSRGVYQRVLENVRWLHRIGYTGDIVARMAVSEQTDIYQAVRHLLDLQDPRFRHVHWQLNVFWDAEGNWHDFDRWVQDSYRPGITRLVNEWVLRMRRGVVEGIAPFIPVMHDLLTGSASELRCGSGRDTFAIHVDGSIGVCPISPDWEFSIVGDIWHTEPTQLARIMSVEEPCPSCDEYSLCGGRCLFANRERLWGEAGFRKVCDIVKYYLSLLRDQVPTVRQLLRDGIVRLEQFNYPEYNNGCEIIP